MSKNGTNAYFRGGRRGKFSDFFHDQQDDESTSLFDRGERVVRMGGDTLMAGLRPRISFKQKSRIGLNRNIEFAVHNFVDNNIRMSLNNNKDNNDRQVFMRGRGRCNIRGRLGTSPHLDLRQKITQVVLADAHWYKITIPCGRNFEKDFIIKRILDHIAPDTFVPILYRYQDKSSTFFVDDIRTAKKLLSCDNKIYLNDNFRLHVYIKPGYPQCIIDDALKERLAQAMTKRYNKETNALDLSRFHQDQDLAEDYFCALFQPFMLTTVLDIATQHVPNLQALSLERNKFFSVDRLSTLKTRFENLKILHLGDNEIKDINQIDQIKDLKLEELRLSGNPLCHKYSMRQNEYVSDVRKRFPKLLRLDALELPPPILFDVVEEGLQIPSSKRTFAVTQDVKDIAGQFFQQYFAVFDSENRQLLLNAYHEKASFSMTVSPSLAARPCSYLGESRNLLRLNDQNRRRKMLKHGRLAVLAAISEIPRTRHDWDSFTMDVALFTESLMVVTVTGLFKEIKDEEAPFRYFNRVFIIVPEGSGYCILNEQLSIHNPTQLQHKRAMNSFASISRTTGEVLMSIQEPSVNSQSTSIESQTLTEDVKQQMTVNLSQATNMNMAWSLKCLNEVEWNYEKALTAFEQFFKQGLIPAEAFQQ